MVRVLGFRVQDFRGSVRSRGRWHACGGWRPGGARRARSLDPEWLNF